MPWHPDWLAPDGGEKANSPELRVLVCGGRDYQDKDMVWAVLSAVLGDGTGHGCRPSELIHGCATGADELADDWAVKNWVRVIPFPADWRHHGKAAGPIRNRRMLDGGKPRIVIAFPGGRGTEDMVARARAAGIPVLRVEP